MEQLTKNQAVATSQEAVQNQNEPQLRDDRLLFLAIIQTFFLISWFSLLLLQLLRHLFYRHLKLHRRSEERFSRNAETDLVCRLLLEKKKEHNHSMFPFARTSSLSK